MSPVSLVALLALCTFIVSSVLLTLLRPRLARRGLVDVPTNRSSHELTTIRGAGVGVVGGMAVGLLLAIHAIPTIERPTPYLFTLCVLAFATLGWLEDVRGLKVTTRLVVQMVLACVVAFLGASMSEMPLDVALIAAIGGVFYVNAANFMDGVNGISSLHGVVVAAYYCSLAIALDAEGLAVAAAVTGGAFLGFLPWNVPRARMFLGDSGSYALGAAAWMLCLWTIAIGVSVITALAPLLVYSADVIATLIARAWRGANLLQAHREHVYQRIHQATGSHAWATAATTIATLGTAAAGLWQGLDPSATVPAAGIVVTIVALYLSLPLLLTRHNR